MLVCDSRALETQNFNKVSPIKFEYLCNDVIMGAIASQITSPTIAYSIVYSDADQRKHQSSASLAFVREIHRGPVNSPHKRSVTWKMFPFDDVIMRGMDISWLMFVCDSRALETQNCNNVLIIKFEYLCLKINQVYNFHMKHFPHY